MEKNLLEKEELQKQLTAIIEKEHAELIDAHYEEFQKHVGKCFKYKNSYGGDSKQWWMYTKVTEVKKSDMYVSSGRVLSHYTGFSFQVRSDGAVEVKTEEYGYIHSLQKEISQKEFDAAWNKMIKAIYGIKGLTPPQL